MNIWKTLAEFPTYSHLSSNNCIQRKNRKAQFSVVLRSRQRTQTENCVLKLLFDQNISPKIIRQVESGFAGSKQVRHVGLEDASDVTIFDYARKHNFTIVTFDSDFVDLNIIKGIPPKIIWLKTGNLTTKSISELLRNSILVIHQFVESDEEEILEIIKNTP